MGVAQPSISAMFTQYKIKRRCQGCGRGGVTAGHKCPNVELAVVYGDTTHGGFLGCWEATETRPAVTVGDLGDGDHPIVISCADRDFHLSRESAGLFSEMLRTIPGIPRISGALAEGSKG